MQAQEYENYLKKKEEEYESVCIRCGRCCGAGTNPCENLILLDDGTYFCKDYANRLGRHKSVNGMEFSCIPMRELVENGTAPQGCAYTLKRTAL